MVGCLLFIGLGVDHILEATPAGELRTIVGRSAYAEVGRAVFPAVEGPSGPATCTRSACKSNRWRALQGKPAVAQVDAEGQVFSLSVDGIQQFTLEDVAKGRAATVTQCVLALILLAAGAYWMVYVLRRGRRDR